MRPRSRFTMKETTKPTRDDMKIQQGEVPSKLHRLKNIYNRLTPKQRNG